MPRHSVLNGAFLGIAVIDGDGAIGVVLQRGNTGLHDLAVAERRGMFQPGKFVSSHIKHDRERDSNYESSVSRTYADPDHIRKYIALSESFRCNTLMGVRRRRG